METVLDLSTGAVSEEGAPTAHAPSLENPTWEYLHSNFKKTDLQKRCRELGFNKIWVTKEKLVDMIMSKHDSPSNDNNEQQRQMGDADSPLQKIISDIIELKGKVSIKDVMIEELNDMLKTAYVTINKLSDRVTALEDEVRRSKEVSSNSAPGQDRAPTNSVSNTRPPCEKTLLLGDTNLSYVRAADLGEDCFIRTIKEANVDLLKCWVEEKLNWSPTRCILYCGLQDILEDASPTTILDNVGMLISILKQRCDNMEFYICQLVPTLKEGNLNDKILSFNEQLMDWSHSNGVSIIKTDLPFRLGTGDLDELCFDVQDGEEFSGVLLNRLGAIRLLSTIKKQCPHFKLCHDWNSAKRYYTKFNNGDNNNTGGGKAPTRLRINDLSMTDNREMRCWSDYNRTSQIKQNIHNTKFSSNWQNEKQDHLHRPHFNRRALSNEKRARGCHNCGEYNHHQSSCRYDHKIRCALCHSLGHKSKLCLQYRR